MSKHTDSRATGIRSRSVQRARAIWTELDFVQRRMLDQTGLGATRRAEVTQLEHLYHQRSA
jgi:hypothetical protein